MSLQTVQFTARHEHAGDVEAALAGAFDGLAEAAPAGVRFLAIRRDGTDEFLFLLHLCGGATNPLPAIPAAADLRDRLGDWAATSPAPVGATVLGDYRTLEAG